MTRIREDSPHHIRAVGSAATRLAAEAHKLDEEKSMEELVPAEYLTEFKSVFDKGDWDKLPECRQWDHAIKLKPDSTPFSSKVYPLTLAEQVELDKFIEEHLQTGRIRPSKSPIASPFFFVKKKDGKLRPVQDYRKLNAMTIRNQYPLPLISEVLFNLRNAKRFTKLDVRWGYNNVRIKEGDEHKAAFVTNRGLYEPLVMFFGLTNSLATFQNMMNDIFRDLIMEGHVIVYMDDILIFTKDMETHRRVVKDVLRVLQKYQLYLKPDKCEFEKEELEYLGVLVGYGKTRMDPVKVNGVRDWPTPKTVKEVQSFLGFVNFYRRFIEGFSHIARPLNNLTRKSSRWRWSDVEEKAFQDLKMAVTTNPVLHFPTDTDIYRVEADSSDFATGAVLSQCQKGIWVPIEIP